MIPLESNPLYKCTMTAFDHCVDAATNKIAIDIGANEGGYTNILLGHGYKKVTAFEPVPDMFAKLHGRYKDDPRVVCHNLGVSDSIGVIKNVTVLNAWTVGNPRTVNMGICPSYQGHPLFDMQIVTIDSMQWPDGVGFIKLDVDGYEHKVLRGAWNVISTFQPPILCEFSGYIAKCGDDPKAFVNDIFRLGYHVFRMDGQKRFTTWEEIEPCYPFDTSFDVMLIPAWMGDAVLAKFNK